MRRVVKISHVRCGEWDGNTYILAPEGTTQAKLQADTNLAAENYLTAIADFKTQNARPPTTRLEDYPGSTTIAEAKELIELEKETRINWEKKRNLATRGFSGFMFDLGYETLSEGTEEEIPDVEYDWGHRHGEKLDYQDKQINKWSLYE
jgi:hypothetical protein